MGKRIVNHHILFATMHCSCADVLLRIKLCSPFCALGISVLKTLIDDSQGPHDRAYHDGPLQWPVWYLGGYTISGRCGSNENVSAVRAPARMASAAIVEGKFLGVFCAP